MNLGRPSADSPGDYEPIDDVIAASPNCKDPVEIECRRSIDGLPWDSTGQIVSCDTWAGLSCNDTDQSPPICFDYEVRLGCYKNIPECSK